MAVKSYRRFAPLEHAVGTDTTLTISLLDSIADALSVVGASAEWNVFVAAPRRKRKPFKGKTILTKTSLAGDITLSEGSAVITIADTDLNRKSGAYWHVLTLTDSSGNVSHLGQGPLSLLAIS